MDVSTVLLPYEGSIGKQRTDELAVMIDTFRPLRLTAEAAALEDETYAGSWSPVTLHSMEGGPP